MQNPPLVQKKSESNKLRDTYNFLPKSPLAAATAEGGGGGKKKKGGGGGGEKKGGGGKKKKPWPESPLGGGRGGG